MQQDNFGQEISGGRSAVKVAAFKEQLAAAKDVVETQDPPKNRAEYSRRKRLARHAKRRAAETVLREKFPDSPITKVLVSRFLQRFVPYVRLEDSVEYHRLRAGMTGLKDVTKEIATNVGRV